MSFSNLLTRNGPESGEYFEPSNNINDALKKIASCRVCLVGAGGLGCELLKDLLLMGFRTIDVIDMDVIDVSNLNRQFLFRSSDVGQSKAEVAVRFCRERILRHAAADCEQLLRAHFCKIQDKPRSFYANFDLVICGLDSIDARRWMNSMLCDLVHLNEKTGEPALLPDGTPPNIIPMIDGGTEGLKGHARVIVPYFTACFECTIDQFPPQTNYPICTLANTPRIPEHCIEWASLIYFPSHFLSSSSSSSFTSSTSSSSTSSSSTTTSSSTSTTLDPDNPQHIQFIYDAALKRANQFGIRGVTFQLTKGVIKRIIPAVASTNAMISAVCANEAFKYVTDCAQSIDNYMMYNGASGAYLYTFAQQKNPDCCVCAANPVFRIDSLALSDTIQDLLQTMKDIFQLKSPSLRTVDARGLSVYIQSPPQLEKATRANLKKPLSTFLGSNHQRVQFHFTDPSLSKIVNVVQIELTKNA